GFGCKCGCSGVSDGDQHISNKAIPASALDRRTSEEGTEVCIVQPCQFGKCDVFKRLSCMKLGFFRGQGEFVPWANRKAIVATKYAIADRRAEFEWNMSLVFDGEIGDATASIELIRRDESFGGANIEAAMTLPAMIVLSLVGRQIEGGENGSDKKPRTEITRHNICMLALPSQSCPLRKRLFHYRRGVDEDLHIGFEGLVQEAGNAFEFRFQNLVIIVAQGVDRNVARFFP